MKNFFVPKHKNRAPILLTSVLKFDLLLAL